MKDQFIERQITIGFIVSTEYLQQIRQAWNPTFIESDTARQLISWCIDYFDEYHKAPNKHIQDIYITKLKAGLDQAHAEWIESVLESLSEEYERGQFNVSYLTDQTRKYFQERYLKTLIEDAEHELIQGHILEAEEIISKYAPVIKDDSTSINPFSESVRSKIKQAFSEREKPLIKFPKALGKFWNQELIRGGFVALMGREKVGKTFMLIELALRAMKSGCNVAFFQAGDMTELQQLRRIAIYLAGKSDQERYCGDIWIPTIDCILNQTDECDNEVRENNEPVFQNHKDISHDQLVEAAKNFPDHQVCYNCNRMKGTPWLKLRKAIQPLTWPQAYKHLRQFGKKWKKQFKLSSHANETLTISQIKSYLSIWEKQENFIPDVIIIDYADILAPDPDFSRADFRQQQNKIWQRLRNLSQERHCLVLTVTQIKALGYSKELLSMNDFSEDKRKFAHVTAMYGLNQTPEEKQIGIMRINELVVREADFNPLRPITILQRLQVGRPYLGAYW